jgi:CRISPR system Cascade subunit CasA
MDQAPVQSNPVAVPEVPAEQVRFNLLKESCIRTEPGGAVSLPGVLALLSQDQVDSFPALRPHQRPAWHMFLVQLAALALHRAGLNHAPEHEDEWRIALRKLTPEFPDDEPWCLVVPDKAKPAFLQPPVPVGKKLSKTATTPDVLDVLITSRNHSVKQQIAWQAEAEDWIFSLVSLQTTANYGGGSSYWVARLNNPCSRIMLALVPVNTSNPADNRKRLGRWFKRDVELLLTTRSDELHKYQHSHSYMAENGIGLIWIEDWPVGERLLLKSLDIWFVEVCRRVRLRLDERGKLTAEYGGSEQARIDAREHRGAVGDPWMPVSNLGRGAFKLEEEGFTYKVLYDLLISGKWELPLLAKPATSESGGEGLALVAEALVTGQGKTWGFKSRILPTGGKIAWATTQKIQREQLDRESRRLMKDSKKIIDVLERALATLVAGGDLETVSPRRKVKCRKSAQPAKEQLERKVDEFFFRHLWTCFEAQSLGQDRIAAATDQFHGELLQAAISVFEGAKGSMPCRHVIRPKAEVQAWTLLKGELIQFASKESAKQYFSEPEEARDRVQMVVDRLAVKLLEFAPGPLAELCRMEPSGPGGTVFWWLVAEAGIPDLPQQLPAWIQLVRILAILTPKGVRSPTVQLQDSQRRLGEVLCDGGNPRWSAQPTSDMRPVYSEARLARFLSLPTNDRGTALETIARILTRTRSPEVGIQCKDFANLLLHPSDPRPIHDLARFYFTRLHALKKSYRNEGKHS